MLKTNSKISVLAAAAALVMGGLLFVPAEIGRAEEHAAPSGHDEHGGGHAEKEAVDPNTLKIKVRELPSDFLLPATLWDQLLVHEVKAVVPLPEEPGEMTSSSVVFSSARVILTEKNPGVLKSPVIDIEFPKGGGEIDLAQYTTGTVGTFFVRFVLPGGDNAPNFEAFHYSKARKRKVDERIYGGGCKFFYRITKVLASQRDKRGIPVNTTRDFHVSTLGGHFMFSWKEGDAVQVTQVKFTSSTRPDLFCQSHEEKVGEE